MLVLLWRYFCSCTSEGMGLTYWAMWNRLQWADFSVRTASGSLGPSSSIAQIDVVFLLVPGVSLLPRDTP